jgi:hypothetical protein
MRDDTRQGWREKHAIWRSLESSVTALDSVSSGLMYMFIFGLADAAFGTMVEVTNTLVLVGQFPCQLGFSHFQPGSICFIMDHEAVAQSRH